MKTQIQLTNTIETLRSLNSRPLLHAHSGFARLAALPALMLVLLTATGAFAGSAIWNLNPTSNFWETASNWTPATVPNGPNDIATFDVSNTTDVEQVVGFEAEVNGIVFNQGASPFTINVWSASSFEYILTISGVGITNNSGITQTFVTLTEAERGVIQFTNSATAGDLTVFTNGEQGRTEFFDTSSAGSATLIANDIPFCNCGGLIKFADDSTGGTTRVEVFLTGTLDISAHNTPGVAIGSLEGDGLVSLGNNNLTLGSNDLDTTFSGVIEDSGPGGSVTKVGSGRLILTNASTYTGGTTIGGGLVEVRNTIGSATGSGPVQVTGGKLGGVGIIAGPVTIGAIKGGEAVLSPGQEAGKPRTLTILSTLRFNGHGTYRVFVDSDDSAAGQVVANGVTIKSRDRFSLKDLGQGILRSAELYDAGDGIWTPTGNLDTARRNHTATLLPNGKVLVAGGDSTTGLGSTLSSAELYDPATDTWTDTGSLTTARSIHTATLLPDGKVLVAGGNLGFGPTESAELYDPASGTWTPTGSMTTAHYYHTATLLPNGKVLVVGNFGSITPAELYDPASGTWATTGSPITSRFSHTATLLPNGKVLVAAGSSGSGSSTALAELYDPATGTWTPTGNLDTARSVHTATLLLDGKVLVAGGFGRTFILTSAELYDPASGTWTVTGSLAVRRDFHTATLLPDGEVIAVGGNNSINFMEPSTELYDPASGTWTTTGSLDLGRYSHTASLLPDGKVLVAGGVGIGLKVGTVFTVINNTATTPINGTFTNLPEGAKIFAGRVFEASYKGGDGNDLTLTVVP